MLVLTQKTQVTIFDIESKVIITQEQLPNPQVKFLTTDILILAFADDFAFLKFTEPYGRHLKSVPQNCFQEEGTFFTVTK